MFWKPLDKLFKMSKSLNKKIQQNTSKIGPKMKKHLPKIDKKFTRIDQF